MCQTEEKSERDSSFKHRAEGRDGKGRCAFKQLSGFLPDSQSYKASGNLSEWRLVIYPSHLVSIVRVLQRDLETDLSSLNLIFTGMIHCLLIVNSIIEKVFDYWCANTLQNCNLDKVSCLQANRHETRQAVCQQRFYKARQQYQQRTLGYCCFLFFRCGACFTLPGLSVASSTGAHAEGLWPTDYVSKTSA